MKKYIKPYFETRKSEFRILDGVSDIRLQGAGGDGQNFTLCSLFNQRFKGTHLQIAKCSSLFSSICLSRSGTMASLNFDLYPQLCEGLGFLP